MQGYVQQPRAIDDIYKCVYSIYLNRAKLGIRLLPLMNFD